MDNQIVFVLTMITGEVVRQEFKCKPEETGAYINQGLVQYATVGYLRKDGAKFILTCPSQIKMVEVEVPTVIIASPADIPKGPLVVG